MNDKALKQLEKLLNEFYKVIYEEQPLAAQVIALVRRWVTDEIQDR